MLSVELNAFWLLSLRPIALGLSATTTASGHLWSPTVYHHLVSVSRSETYIFGSGFLANEAANAVNIIAMTMVYNNNFRKLLGPEAEKECRGVASGEDGPAIDRSPLRGRWKGGRRKPLFI